CFAAFGLLPNSLFLQQLPQWLKGCLGVAIKRPAADAPETPAASLQLPLARHVRVVAILAEPVFVVAFHRLPSAGAADDEVDLVPREDVLRQHAIPAAANLQIHVHLEP